MSLISIATQASGGVIFGVGTDMGGDLPSLAWLWAVPLLIGIGLWLLLVRSSLVRGGSMERPERVPQLYGYTVCLVAIVVMLASVSNIVEQAGCGLLFLIAAALFWWHWRWVRGSMLRSLATTLASE